MAKIFITGGTGCIGAVTVYKLLSEYGDQIEQILIASRSSSADQLEIWFGDELRSHVNSGKIAFAKVDIGDTNSLRHSLQDFAPTHLIHLGALQSPDCAAYPEKGVAINLTGTMTLFHMVAELEKPLERFVFASSGAVYGKRAMYPGATVPENAQLAPPNLYGVWKVAGEHLAALFHEQTGIPTVSLRLNTTFGPGRDQGTTSAPTRVMKSLAIGASEGKTIPSSMPYKGRENYHYVEDVGAHFAGVCMMPFEGCEAFNIKGKTTEVAEFLDTIKAVSEELEIANFLDTGIADEATPNLFICDLDDSLVEAKFPGLPRTDLKDGIRKTLVRFMKMAPAGKIKT
ncbi:MAG: NAD-dependent epimerase/dehydratase family protein [Mariniblastus sp.]